MRHKTDPNGACLDECVAVHVYEDKDEATKVKKRINMHVAENWDTYYKYKIPLPYIETVGVGAHSKTVIKNTREEMIKFLKGEEDDDALMVYSNSQQLLAIANLFNIKINVFTYGNNQTRWSQICPDAEMSAKAEVRFGKWAPDMSLYHSDNTHYDLLVKDDSRVALLGLLLTEESFKENESDHVVEDEWKIVNKKKKNVGQGITEELLKEDVFENGDLIDITEEITTLDEETTLANAKKKGFRRISPQEVPERSSSEPIIHKCMECKFEFESDGILEAHIKTHTKSVQVLCKVCSESFVTEECLKVHMLSKHNSRKNLNEWNCNDCAFEANCASELMKHLKITGHQPSKNVKDKRMVFEDYKQCFTCKMDFDGFYNLMNHRKSVHPSNKKCRNFLNGKCTFSDECWYVHEEILNAENSSDNFKCDLCAKEYKGRANFMRHKKLLHIQFVPHCEQFSLGNCSRGEKECWFVHRESRTNEVGSDPWPKLIKKSPTKTNESGFQKASPHTVPPGADQLNMMMKMIGNLCSKIEKMEDKFEDLMN